MRTQMLLAALLTAGLSDQTFADQIGDAFCVALHSQIATPTPGEIYFKDATGQIQSLPHGSVYKGSNQPDLFYFRDRNDVPLGAPGVVTIKITFALKAAERSAGVGLVNNLRSGRDKCTSVGIETYERFHGPSRTPNSCLQYGFHQTTPFDTLANSQRWASFLFDVPGIDVRPVTADLGFLIPSIFFHPQSWFSPSSDPAAPQGAAVRYRSWIFNYRGQPQNGTCIHFKPVFTAEYLGAAIVANDLLETSDNEFIANQWSFSFVQPN